MRLAFDPERKVVHYLPIPSWQMPDLVMTPDLPPEPSCAEAVEAGEQSPLINQAMSALVLEFVRRLLEQRLTWMSAYLDLERGILRTVETTPENVVKAAGMRRDETGSVSP